MSRTPPYSDNALAVAVAQSRSWRGVLRALGLNAASGSAIRAVRQSADALLLDHSHFTGQRRWTDEQLAAAVRASDSWSHVADALGLRGGSWQATFKAHAVRLSLDIGHLQTKGPTAQLLLRHRRQPGVLPDSCGCRRRLPRDPFVGIRAIPPATPHRLRISDAHASCAGAAAGGSAIPRSRTPRGADAR